MNTSLQTSHIVAWFTQTNQKDVSKILSHLNNTDHVFVKGLKSNSPILDPFCEEGRMTETKHMCTLFVSKFYQTWICQIISVKINMPVRKEVLFLPKKVFNYFDEYAKACTTRRFTAQLFKIATFNLKRQRKGMCRSSAL